MDAILCHLKEFGVGIRNPHDDFFESGNKNHQFWQKVGCCSENFEDGSDALAKSDRIKCSECPLTFSTPLDHDNHFHTAHMFICSECKKNLPTAHLLDLHFSEKHDSFFSVLSLRKPMFKCFVENCNNIFSTYEERKKHCIEDHKFPSRYKYFEPNKSTNDDKMELGDPTPEKMDVTKEKKSNRKRPKCLGSGVRSQRSSNSALKSFTEDLRNNLPQ